MPLKNTESRYGWVSITLHWGMAATIVAMFALGLWMRGLSYYDEWYRLGPFIHKSVGMILLALLLLRIVWKLINPKPAHDPDLHPWEKISASAAHLSLYVLMLAIMVAGYLISTADGRAISVFDWFEIPALIQGLPNQEDIAGEIHEILAWALIAVAAIHAAAALKHHFFDGGTTLVKMLGRSRRQSNHPQKP